MKTSEMTEDEEKQHNTDLGGTISGEHGIGIAKKRWFGEALDPGALGLHRRLKAALDPDGILNPGKFV